MKICRRLVLTFWKSQSGLTLIEVVVVMVLIGILAGFIANIVSYEADTYDRLVNQTDGLQVSRNAVQILLKDLRQIMSADSIFLAAQDSIKFDLIDDVFVSYRFINNNIIRNEDLLLTSVETAEFAYFDSVGTALSAPVSTPSDISTIDISLTTSMNGQPFTINTKVKPRNF